MRPRSLLFSIPAFVFALAVVPAHDVRAEEHGHAHHAAPMTDAEMQKWVDDYYAIHPRVGVNRVGGVGVTVSVFSFRFEADGNPGTQVDTVKIAVGETVTWQFGSGSHTVTNGTGFADPNVGTLFDQPINQFQTSFTFQFDNAGLVPYFCQPHISTNNMKGFVLVQSTTGVTPLPGNNAALGFTRSPRPNPTRAGVDFQFALNQAGQARIEVFDARGARVATVKDGTLPPGSYSGSWDGTGADGVAVGSGVYYLRMTLPGYSKSLRVVVAR